MTITSHKLVIKRIEFDEINELFYFRKSLFAKNHLAHDKDLWRWKFFDTEKNRYNFFVIKNNNEIVGTQGYIECPFYFENKTLKAIFLVDFFVLKAFRGLPVIQLFRKVCKYGDIQIGINNSSFANRFFRSAKWIDRSETVINLFYYSQYPGTSFLGRIKFFCKKIIFHKKRIDNEIKIQDVQITESIPEKILNSLRTESNDLYFKKDKNFIKKRYIDIANINYLFAYTLDENDFNCLIVFKISKAKQNWLICDIIDIINYKLGHFNLELIIERLKLYLSSQNKKYVINFPTSNSNLINIFKKAGFSWALSNLGYYINGSSDKLMIALHNSIKPFINLGDSDRY